MSHSLFGRREAFAALALLPLIPGALAAESPVASTPPPPAAAPAAPLDFTVESAVAHALANNRDLRAAGHLVEEAQGRLDGSGRLPNPEFEVGFSPGVTSARAYRFSAGVTQRIPVTSRLKLATEVSASEVPAAREEIKALRRDLIGEVKTDAVQALALRAEARLLDARIRLAREAVSLAKNQADAGAASSLDLAYAGLALSDLRAESDRLAVELDATLNRLKVRLALPEPAALTISGELPDPPATPATGPAFAATDTPGYRRGLALADGADSAVRLAEARKWGDIGVGLFGDLERDVGGGPNNPAGFIGVKVSVPLPLWDDNRGEIRSARARRERLRAELEAELMRTRGVASAEWKNYARLCAAIAPVRDELMPAARTLTERVREARSRGELGYVELLRAREKETELEKRLISLRRDAELARIRWETAAAAHPALREAASGRAE